MEESTFIPLAKGEVNIPTTANIKLALPYNVLIQAHVAPLTQDRETGIGLVQTTDQDGNAVQKIVVKLVIDQEVKDRDTKESLKSKTLSKWLPYKNSEKSDLGKLRIATLGPDSVHEDPTEIAGKPLLLMVTKDTFNGKEFDKYTYLPAADGQKVPTFADNYPLQSDEEIQEALNKVFAGEK